MIGLYENHHHHPQITPKSCRPLHHPQPPRPYMYGHRDGGWWVNNGVSGARKIHRSRPGLETKNRVVSIPKEWRSDTALLESARHGFFQKLRVNPYRLQLRAWQNPEVPPSFLAYASRWPATDRLKSFKTWGLALRVYYVFWRKALNISHYIAVKYRDFFGHHIIISIYVDVYHFFARAPIQWWEVNLSHVSALPYFFTIQLSFGSI